MLKRLLIALAFTALMVAPVAADDLGPTPANTSVGADPGTLNVLQPAGSAGIPSANALSGGLALPDASSSLQPAGTKADLPANLDLSSEADGAPQSQTGAQPNPAASNLNMIIIALISLFLLICAVLLYRISKVMETVPALDDSGGPNTASDADGTSLELDEAPETAQIAQTAQAKVKSKSSGRKKPRKSKKP